jgi:hypothetical protein
MRSFGRGSDEFVPSESSRPPVIRMKMIVSGNNPAVRHAGENTRGAGDTPACPAGAPPSSSKPRRSALRPFYSTAAGQDKDYSFRERFVNMTPARTRTAPTMRERLIDSSRISQPKKTPLTGTKLMKTDAREGPIFPMPS